MEMVLVQSKANLSDCSFTKQDQLDTTGGLGCAGISHDEIAGVMISVDRLELSVTVTVTRT